MREIAEVIGRGLKVPVVSLSQEEAQAHFGWLAMFAGFDMPASSAQTRQRLGWHPTGPGLIADLEQMRWSEAVKRDVQQKEREMTKVWGATSTTDDVLSGIDLHGKRILVTGVSAGIGVETARALAAHGAQVTGAARDLEKAEAATAQVRKDAAANGGSFELVALDLASLKSVRACADRLLAQRGAVRRGHCQCRSDGDSVWPYRGRL